MRAWHTFALEKIIMAEVSGHIQSRMRHPTSPPPECLWPANLVGWWLTVSRSYPFSHLILWLRGLPRSRDKLKTTISPLTLSMATTLGRIMTYLERLLAIKSHVPLVMWSCKMTWQTKIIISPQPQCLWPRNLSWWWPSLRGSWITWCYEIKFQFKNSLSPLPKCVSLPNLPGWWLT